MKHSMRIGSRLFILMLALLVTACNFQRRDRDKDDPEPDLSGTYRFSSYTVDGEPVRNGGEIIVRRINDTDVELKTNEDGADPGRPNVFKIRKSSGKVYDMYNLRDQNIGTIDGTELTLDFIVDNSRFELVARKR